MILRLQQPIEIDEARAQQLICDPKYCLQIKLDGERRLVEIKGGIVRAWRRNGEEVEPPALPAIRDMVLDGEQVGDDFLAFDLLEIDGKNIRGLAMLERWEQLYSISAIRENVCPIHKDQISKEMVLANSSKSGMEGVVFKQMDAPYKAVGEEAFPRTFKVKFKKTASFIVSGTNGRSVEIATYDGKDRGKVDLPAEDMVVIGSIIEVQYHSVHESCKLREPVFKAIRKDIPVSRCLIPETHLKAGV